MLGSVPRHCRFREQVVEFEDLGMEAVWRIEVAAFPAFIIIDDKGNDFYADSMAGRHVPLS